MAERKSKTTLEISDYLSAAALRARGIRFLGVTPGNGARVGLVFSNEDGRAGKLLEEHLNGGFDVNSSAFCEAIRMMKDAIFGARR